MVKLGKTLPLFWAKQGRAKRVTIVQRVFALLFGSPNARRGNGIIYSGCDISSFWRRIQSKFKGTGHELPVFEIDRIGSIYEERLPRIWLSEQIYNTRSDGSGRLFVECYPAGPDRGGEKALELGDRYLGEGYRHARSGSKDLSIECFQAAEILYMHAVRRGSRDAAARLRNMYERDLCEGKWFQEYFILRAKHAPKHVLRNRRCA